jgi:hypothetical protein
MCFKIKIKTQPYPFGQNPETSEKKILLDFEHSLEAGKVFHA